MKWKMKGDRRAYYGHELQVPKFNVGHLLRALQGEGKKCVPTGLLDPTPYAYKALKIGYM